MGALHNAADPISSAMEKLDAAIKREAEGSHAIASAAQRRQATMQIAALVLGAVLLVLGGIVIGVLWTRRSPRLSAKPRSSPPLPPRATLRRGETRRQSRASSSLFARDERHPRRL